MSSIAAIAAALSTSVLNAPAENLVGCFCSELPRTVQARARRNVVIEAAVSQSMAVERLEHTRSRVRRTIVATARQKKSLISEIYRLECRRDSTTSDFGYKNFY